MASVFISSVIRGFEDVRDAARKAVEAMGHTAIMSESFGARPYSSELACLDQASRCDVYLLIMGETYGFETDEGVSVTHAEFRAARSTNRPILAFVQSCDKEERQAEFQREVEHYSEGQFRQSFSSAVDLATAIAESLRHFEAQSHSLGDGELRSLLSQPIESISDSWNSDPELVVACLPIPERMINLAEYENASDDVFGVLCNAGLTHLRDGYKLRREAEWTGIESGRLKHARFSNGLTLGIASPITVDSGSFRQFFVSPHSVEVIAKGIRTVFDTSSGHVYLALRHMGSAYVAEHPGGNSVSMRMGDPEEKDFDRLFTPITQGDYEDWVDHCVSQLERAFAYPNR